MNNTVKESVVKKLDKILEKGNAIFSKPPGRVYLTPEELAILREELGIPVEEDLNFYKQLELVIIDIHDEDN